MYRHHCPCRSPIVIRELPDQCNVAASARDKTPFGHTVTDMRFLIFYYVAAKATYIRLLHGKIGILEGFFGPSSVHRGRTHIVFEGGVFADVI